MAKFKQHPRLPEGFSTTFEGRFLKSFTQNTKNSCWEWFENHLPTGYGLIGRGKRAGKIELAHRASWMLFRGEIPKHLCVLHHCDNPTCVNPEHLYLGTRVQNMRDCIKRKRHGAITHPEKQVRGEQDFMAKLKSSDIPFIRQSIIDGAPMAVLARKFKVGRKTISNVFHRKTWRHI
jgi:hypothetical protein